MNGNIVQNDVRFAVLEKFSDQHIEIPSTPRAVIETKHAKAWPTDDDKIEADFADQEQAKADAAAEAKKLAKSGRKLRKPDPD
jgi:potassium efflux system protein